MTDTCAPTDHRTWLDLLTADDAGDVLAAALGADGASLGTWRVDRVHARPGAEVTVGYDVVAARGDGAVEAAEYLLATTAPLPPEAIGPGVARLDDGERVLHVWRHPADPMLPGLAAAGDTAELTRRLGAAGHDEQVDAVEIVAYRPLRRAVLRARTTHGAVYVKVVRPDRARALVRRHALLAERAPRCLAWAADGVVLLEEARGRSLAQVLAAAPPERRATAVDPHVLLRALEELPAAATSLGRRPAWAERVGRYARTASEVHGLDPERTARLAEAVADAVATRDPGPVVATHGDFHAANVLLDATGERVETLLDVDTLGPGHRVDDLACVVAHLAVLPGLSPGDYAGTEGLVARCLAAFDDVVDPVALRSRAAGVVLSLASGAATRELAEAWLAVAERLVDAGRDLRPAV
ncbi:aminoglycoside phosphotransferase family protein [Cellulosimicrobium sp. NPDC057127]|uniref:aminoglycoside phosphotransferase family protein n=1 Tax=Cellulosimicrobium sp. NPDC057127 TaxID=3346026 RepID=UPI003644F008